MSGVDITKWLMWQFRSVYTQTSASGGAFNFRLEPAVGTRLVWYYGVIDADNYGVDESFTVSILDEDDNVSAFLLRSIPANNEIITIPLLGTLGDADKGMNFQPGQLPIVGDDAIEIGSGIIADTKKVTIAFRIAYWGDKPPVPDISAGGGTWTTNETQNVVR